MLALGYAPGPLMGELLELGQEIRGNENMLRKLENNTSSEPYTKEEALALIAQAEGPAEAISILKNRISKIVKKIEENSCI